MQGITTHALVQPTGIDFERDGIIESVALLDIRGVEIGHYSISILNENLLLAEPFRPPDVRRVENYKNKNSKFAFLQKVIFKLTK